MATHDNSTVSKIIEILATYSWHRHEDRWRRLRLTNGLGDTMYQYKTDQEMARWLLEQQFSTESK